MTTGPQHGSDFDQATIDILNEQVDVHRKLADSRKRLAALVRDIK
jgi:hypothetical protein